MIGIIDYGVGNLRSVQKAFEFLGINAFVSNAPNEIRKATHIVLPGVGAFCDAMENLRNSGMLDVIAEAVMVNKPFLGICLGMQLFFEKSYEGGIWQGLNFLPGEITSLPSSLKVPHMGWNRLKVQANPLFRGLGEDPYVYFVHSYYANTEEKDIVIASTEYGFEFPAAVAKGNLFGLQFHPEKSGNIGLRILENFGGLS